MEALWGSLIRHLARPRPLLDDLFSYFLIPPGNIQNANYRYAMAALYFLRCCFMWTSRKGSVALLDLYTFYAAGLMYRYFPILMKLNP